MVDNEEWVKLGLLAQGSEHGGTLYNCLGQYAERRELFLFLQYYKRASKVSQKIFSKLAVLFDRLRLFQCIFLCFISHFFN